MYRIFLLLMLLSGTELKAQMGAAQKIVWDADTAAVFSVKSAAVWDLIKETGKWNEFSNGLVTAVTVTGDHPGQTRLLKFSDGKERRDIVGQFQPEYKMIVLRLADPLPAGIQEGTIAWYAKNLDAGGSELRITIIVKGGAKEKEKLLEELKKEAAAYLKGLSDKLSGK